MKASHVVLTLLLALVPFAPAASAAEWSCDDLDGTIGCGCDTEVGGCGTVSLACAAGVAVVNADGVSTNENAQWRLVFTIVHQGSTTLGDDGPVYLGHYTVQNIPFGAVVRADLYLDGEHLAYAITGCLG